jgi:hypothetical protein
LTLKKICKALDVTPNEIVEEEVSVFDRKNTAKPKKQKENKVQRKQVKENTPEDNYGQNTVGFDDLGF